MMSEVMVKVSGEGIVAVNATPNPFLLNKICSSQWSRLIHGFSDNDKK